ncbi:MAG: TIGR03768 family metallophosphoesterase [Coriobacteriales bacterium]|nr:TIGR03768 family metallophosphoesterase [Coriobacteriales bacterium]
MPARNHAKLADAKHAEPKQAKAKRASNPSAAPETPTTADRTVAPTPVPSNAAKVLPHELEKYAPNGYGVWEYGSGSPIEPMTDLMGADFQAPSDSEGTRLLRFFTITDIHVADVQSPAQAIFFGYNGFLSSAYSGVMMYTHHVLDAAMRTANALHAADPFDFAISLGDTCNNTQRNELRWYIDVIDGEHVEPDAGARQNGDDGPRASWLAPYRATGLDRSIPWYQVRGNHDHFWTGYLRVDDYLRPIFTGDEVLNLGNVFEDPAGPNSRGFYMGCLDGSTECGDVFGLGPVASFAEPPKVLAANPERRSLSKSEWMAEFFASPSNPRGHGFDESRIADGFACYSFEPVAGVPLKVIALDDTQGDEEPYDNGYGHVSLDKERHHWLIAELDKGQAEGKLIIIAAHCPIGVEEAGAPMSWSSGAFGTEEELLAKLHTYPNLVLWVAGHRHRNTITPMHSPDPAHPELGFWEVETAALRDFPQQMRTFELATHGDVLAIRAVNVDPDIEPGTPAARSREYAVAAQEIFDNQIDYLPLGVRNAEMFVQLAPEMAGRLA